MFREGLFKIDKEAEKAAKRYSIIHWQTGKPTEGGYYLTTLKNGKIRSLVWSPTLGYFTNYCLMEKIYDVVAWCKLSDIEPYKEETKQWEQTITQESFRSMNERKN